MKITELLAWLESKAPYSTAEGDQRHAEIAALCRAAQAVVDAAQALHFKADRDGQPVLIGMLQLSEALAACEKIMEGEG